ncbi:MAG TPA: dihydroneopterin aldolase [Acidimicrobiales bacterium]|nr:dihydroneopterin aldolase [Acidimicrobiales bacterium]
MPERPVPEGHDRGERPVAADRIEIKGLRFLGSHGTLPEELARDQPFEIDLVLWADLEPAGRTDDLALTVDYGGLCETVRSVMQGEHVALMERLAQKVAAFTLAFAGERASAVEVAIRKLRPPVGYDVASAGVRIYRQAGHVGEGAAFPGEPADAVPRGRRA